MTLIKARLAMVKGRGGVAILTLICLLYPSILYPSIFPMVQAQPRARFSVISVVWGSPEKPMEAGPGDRSVPLSVVLRNDGASVASSLSGYLNLTHPFSGIAEPRVASAHSGVAVAPGHVGTLSFYVNIAKNASLGFHPLNMTLRWLEAAAFGNIYIKGRSYLTVDIPLLGKAFFNIIPSKQLLLGGSVNNLLLTIVNNGTAPAYSIELTLKIPPPLGLMNKDDRWVIESVEPKGNATIEASIYAPLGVVGSTKQLTLSLTYRTVYGFSRTEARTLSVAIPHAASSGVVLSVVAYNTDIVAGVAENKVTLTVTNEGILPARQLAITLTLPPPLSIVGRGNQWYFESLNPKESIKIDVSLYVPAASLGLSYQPSLRFSYVDSFGFERVETTVIGISVRGFIELHLTRIVLTPSPAKVNRDLTISAVVINEGTVAAKVVNISIIPEHPFAFTPASTVFIGEIPSGSQVPFRVGCIVRPALNGTYPLKIALSYKDDRNVRRTQLTTLQVEVVSIPPPPRPEVRYDPTAILWTFLPIALAGLVGFILGTAITILVKRRGRVQVEGEGGGL